ncbi:MAG: Rieske (2Fe-2S) protein [Kofleriaceae bacterium]|nr:Rieske (2Fe-2S) protein [Kofleriaceae bacterium]
MSKDSSIRAQLSELLGEEWNAPDSPLRREKPKRLTIYQALKACDRLSIIAAVDKGREVAVAVLADGTKVVLTDACPHDGGLLSDGFVEGNRIVCARHGWEFDGLTGECAHKPGLRVACEVLSKSEDATES